MANPSTSIIVNIQDGASGRLLRVGADGSINFTGGAAAATTPSASRVWNVADGTNAARLLGVSATGTVTA